MVNPAIDTPTINENVPADVRRVYGRDDVAEGFVVAINQNMAPNDPASHTLTVDKRVAIGLLTDTDGTAKVQMLRSDAARDIKLTEGEVFWCHARGIRLGTNYLGTTNANLFALFPPSAGYPDDEVLTRTKWAGWETDSGDFDSTDFTVEWTTQHITQDEIQLRRFKGTPAEPTTIEYLTSATGGRGNTATWVDVASDLRELTLPYGWLTPGQTWLYQIKVRNSDDQETPWSPALRATGLPGRVSINSPVPGLVTSGAVVFRWTVENFPQDEIQVRRGIPQPNGLIGIQYLNSITGAWTTTERWLDVADTLRQMSFNAGWHPASLGQRRYQMRVRDSSDVATDWSPVIDLSTTDPG